MQLLDKRSSDIIALSTSNCSDQQNTLRAVEQMNVDLHTLVEEWRNIQPMVSLNRMRKHPRRMLTINTTSNQVREIRTVLTDEPHFARGIGRRLSGTRFNEVSDIVNQKIDSQRAVNGNDPKYISQNRFHDNVSYARASLSCNCKKVTQVTQVNPLSQLHFKKTIGRLHYRWCPKSRTTERNTELMLRIVLPSWTLCYIINLSIVLNWNPNRGWRISPIIVGANRIVNPKTSPAFLALKQTQSLLYSTWFEESQMRIKDLEVVLRTLFEASKASALDEDESGNTPLYVGDVSYLASYFF